jgi:hypothetical protein
LDKRGRKKVLEDNNIICTLTLDSRIKAIFKYFPVRATKVTKGCNKEKRYSTCSLHGHLKGTYDRNDLDYRESHSAALHGIDPSKYGFKNKLSLQQACTLYSYQEHCNCKGNCSLLSRCACKIANRLCTFLCHGGRENNKLCKMMGGFDEPSLSDGDDGNEAEQCIIYCKSCTIGASIIRWFLTQYCYH